MHMALFFCFQRVILSTENVRTQSTFPMILSPQPAALHGCRAHDHEDCVGMHFSPQPLSEFRLELVVNSDLLQVTPLRVK